MKEKKICPNCGAQWEEYWQPGVTADVIAETNDGGIYLIKRKNFPYGWAIPGGFLEKGESLEETAVREYKEETGLEVTLVEQLRTYSKPGRDPRKQTVSTVFIGVITGGHPEAGDDASEINAFEPDHLPDQIAFDHREIIEDYRRWKSEKYNKDKLLFPEKDEIESN